MPKYIYNHGGAGVSADNGDGDEDEPPVAKKFCDDGATGTDEELVFSEVAIDQDDVVVKKATEQVIEKTTKTGKTKVAKTKETKTKEPKTAKSSKVSATPAAPPQVLEPKAIVSNDVDLKVIRYLSNISEKFSEIMRTQHMLERSVENIAATLRSVQETQRDLKESHKELRQSLQRGATVRFNI